MTAPGATPAVRVRTVETAYDTADDPVTVATPTCCCCCCCLVTTTTVSAYAATEAYNRGEENRNGGVIGAVLACLGPIGGIVTMWSILAANGEGTLAVSAGMFVTFTFICAGLLVARVPFGSAAGIAALITTAGTAMFFVEIFGALITAFILELATPLGIWGGIALSNRSHRRRMPRVDRVAYPVWPSVPGQLPPPANGPFPLPPPPMNRPSPDDPPSHPPWR